jgi:prepilin-type N-terminal cleavage/methylation domain-containing protein
LRSKGFTLVELLVVIGIIALLISILLPSLNKARETANKVKCGANLHSLGQSFVQYANDNGGQYPRGVYDNTQGALASVSAANNNSADPFVNGPGPNNVPEELFILARQETLPMAIFNCPSSSTNNPDPLNANGNGQGNRNVMNQSNFTNAQYLSYSIAAGYPSTTATDAGFGWNPTALPSDFALMADINPGKNANTQADITAVDTNSASSVTQRGNSANHARTGQNVLYNDYSVAFRTTCMCGNLSDNIYGPSTSSSGTQSGSSTSGSTYYAPQANTNFSTGPVWAGDSVLLPTSAAGGDAYGSGT